ncbi:hypothetical protein MRX96_056060 [Rhipicephalus microplus]
MHTTFFVVQGAFTTFAKRPADLSVDLSVVFSSALSLDLSSDLPDDPGLSGGAPDITGAQSWELTHRWPLPKIHLRDPQKKRVVQLVKHPSPARPFAHQWQQHIAETTRAKPIESGVDLPSRRSPWTSAVDRAAARSSEPLRGASRGQRSLTAGSGANRQGPASFRASVERGSAVQCRCSPLSWSAFGKGKTISSGRSRSCVACNESSKRHHV